MDIGSKPLSQDLLAVARRVMLRDLADETFAMFSREFSPVYFDSSDADCRAQGFSPRILHGVPSVASQIAVVGYGQRPASILADPRRARFAGVGGPGLVVASPPGADIALKPLA